MTLQIVGNSVTLHAKATYPLALSDFYQSELVLSMVSNEFGLRQIS